MRPRSIVWFERVYAASVALGLANSVVRLDSMQAALSRDLGDAANGMGGAIIFITLGLSLAVSALLWFYIARRASSVAKWLLVAIYAYSLISLPGALAGVRAGLLPAWWLAATWALQIAIVVLLFRPDARAWFARKGTAADDPAVFE